MKKFIALLAIVSFLIVPSVSSAYTMYLQSMSGTPNRDTSQRLKSQYGVSAYYNCYPCAYKDTSNPYTEASCLSQTEYCLERQEIQRGTTCSTGSVYFNGSCMKSDIPDDTMAEALCLLDGNRHWDENSRDCICDSGYTKNSEGDCITYTKSCQNKFGPNTKYLKFDYTDNSRICDCKTGYVWNSQGTGCITAPIIPAKTNDQICQDSYGLNSNWDGTKNENGGLICDCKTDYEWNSNQSSCIKIEAIIPSNTESASDISPSGGDEESSVNESIIKEGAIIQADNGDPDVYIVKYVGTKQFKRLILSPSVFNNYGHLRWEDIQKVSKDVLDLYTTSELVRAVGDNKIYKLYPQGDSGQKRLIKNNSVLERLGFDPDSIYEINLFDRESYIKGLNLE